MNYLNFFSDFNNWFKTYWGLIIFLVIIVIFLIILGIWIFNLICNKFKNKKLNDNNLNIDKKLFDEIGISIKEINLNFKFITLKYTKNNSNNILAWRTLIEILTKVIANTFDDNGSEKKVLDSLYNMFKNIRTDMKNNNNAISTTKILLIFLNQILRPFLAKWDKLINENKVFETNINNSNNKIQTQINQLEINNYQKEFRQDYEILLEKIKEQKYIELLSNLCGMRINLINIKKYTDLQSNVSQNIKNDELNLSNTQI